MRSVFTPKLGTGVMEALEAELLIRAVLIRPTLLSLEEAGLLLLLLE